MQEPRTVSEVMAMLQKTGYTESFQASSTGLKARPSGVVFQPESLLIDKFFRFEGETDLEEESIIFALSCPIKNIKGTYFVAFGAMMDALDVKMVLLLERRTSKKN